MSASDSRFLLPSLASMEEVGAGAGDSSRDLPSGSPGSQEQGSMPSLPLRTARLRPGGSTQTGESQASNSCCSAGPPRPPSPCSPAVHPQPAPGPPGATPRELQEGAQVAAPSSLSTKSWPGVFPACSQVIMALAAGCVVTHHGDLDGLFIADGFGLRGSQQVVVKLALLRNPAFLPALLQNSPGDY